MLKLIFSLLLICLIALFVVWQPATPPRIAIALSAEDAERIGQRIWQNEGAGKLENLIVWNAGEDFPSLGMGHFIWFPKGIDSPFTESFPLLIPYLKNSPHFPQWLSQQRHAPWQNREQFFAQINDTRTLELRRLLHTTFAQQTSFIIDRLRNALPHMLQQLSNKSDRQHVRHQFETLLQQPAGIYALLDYVNFKGEGTSETERYRGEGWGVLQVLQQMKPNAKQPIEEFIRAADLVLTRRVQNAPRDESRWLAGWRKRLDSYRHFDVSDS